MLAYRNKQITHRKKLLRLVYDYSLFSSSSSLIRNYLNCYFFRLICERIYSNQKVMQTHWKWKKDTRMWAVYACICALCVFNHFNSDAINTQTETDDGGSGCSASFNCGVINQINGKFKYTIYDPLFFTVCIQLPLLLLLMPSCEWS